jgi:DNA-binding response OmpR family regulator
MPALVLVAEDDDDLREEVAWSLRVSGYRVLGVGTGEAALWTMMLQRIDLLIIDLKLPKVGGAAVLRLMQDHQQLRSIPVLVITGFPDEAPPDVAVLTKPFSSRLLTDVVNGILGGKPKRRTIEGYSALEEEQDRQEGGGVPGRAHRSDGDR